MNEWINIKDRLPPINENVLLFDGIEVFCGDMNLNKYEKPFFGVQACDGICYGNYEKQEITHWMPLPNPPNQK